MHRGAILSSKSVSEWPLIHGQYKPAYEVIACLWIHCSVPLRNTLKKIIDHDKIHVSFKGTHSPATMRHCPIGHHGRGKWNLSHLTDNLLNIYIYL